MKVSQQLISQHFTKKIITNYLEHSAQQGCGRAERLTYNFRYQDLRIEPWFNCLWTNFGFISYKDLAEFTLICTEAKAYQLPVKKLTESLYLVKGKVKAWYAVYEGKCECALFRLRIKRSSELPQFFKYFPRIGFCHHTASIF